MTNAERQGRYRRRRKQRSEMPAPVGGNGSAALAERDSMLAGLIEMTDRDIAEVRSEIGRRYEAVIEAVAAAEKQLTAQNLRLIELLSELVQIFGKRV
jgi:hypothetical protein